MAVEAMVTMGNAIGKSSDAQHYAAELVQWRAAYDARFWNETAGTYTGDEADFQTLTSVALVK